MTEQTASTERVAAGEDRAVAELREELARNRQEVMRLRDLLIGKDAELGAIRGRLTELEEGSARLVAAAARMRARLALLRSPAAVLAKLRRSRD